MSNTITANLPTRIARSCPLGIPGFVVLSGRAAGRAPPSVVRTNNAAPPLPGVRHKTIKIGDQTIFYREAGDPTSPAIVLLHGFPTSSHMFRNLIPALADRYDVVAPDYPGYGNSSMPAVDKFEYSFENMSRIVTSFIDNVGIEKYALYLMDYGAPIGFRVAVLSGAQAELEASVERCVAENPEQRYDNGHDVAADLRNCFGRPRLGRSERSTG